MIIYKITNKINNKCYIGRTIRSLSERYKEHIKSAINNDQRHLYQAMRKYGIDNFKIESIDNANNLKDLQDKEMYWVNFYDSYNKGYNMTLGGDINPMECDISKLSHDNKMRSLEVRIKISKKVKENRNDPNSKYNTPDYHKKLSEAAKGNQKYKGKKRPQHAIEAASKSLAKKVYCIDLSGNIIKEFNYVKDAALWWYDNGYNSVKYYYDLCNRIKKSYTKNIYIKNLKWIYK